MSINFEKPIGPEAAAMIRELFGEAVAMDERTTLLDKINTINKHEMTKLANLAGQPVSVEINGEGDIKTMSDGTRYQATRKGWRKIVE